MGDEVLVLCRLNRVCEEFSAKTELPFGGGFIEIFIEIISNAHTMVRIDTGRSHIHFTQLLLMITFYKSSDGVTTRIVTLIQFTDSIRIFAVVFICVCV